MKHIFIWMGTIFLSLTLAFAQSVEPQVISVAGTQQTTGNVQVSWTIGQTATSTLSSPSTQLTQGFQQSQLIITSLDNLPAEMDLKVFPNPTSSFFQIAWEGGESQLDFQLIDARGKLVDQWKFSQTGKNQYDVSRLAVGSYLLRVQTTHGFTKAFKIQIQN